MKLNTPLIAFTMAFAAPAVAQDIPETELNVVGSIGILSMYTEMEDPFWNETIIEASGGAIKANLRPFNELGFKGGELFSLVSNGTVQLAHQVLPYTSGSVPMNEAPDLVGVVADVQAVQKAAEAFREAHAAYLAEEHNIKLLGYGTYQSQVIYCRDEFGSLSDLAGRTVRAAGASQQVFIEHIDGSPVGMAFGEVPTAMANGTVDCAITGALSGFNAKWHEQANYISNIAINHGVIAAIANLDWWNSLDPAVQEVIETGLRELEGEMFTLAATETKDGLSCNTGGDCEYGEAAGMTLVDASEADLAIVASAATEAVLPAYSKRCGEACTALWNQTIGAAMGYAIE